MYHHAQERNRNRKHQGRTCLPVVRRLRIPSVNSSPVVDFEVRLEDPVRVFRRTLDHQARDLTNGASEWKPLSPEELTFHKLLSTPIGEFLNAHGVDSVPEIEE